MTKLMPPGWIETSLGDVCVGGIEQGPPSHDVRYIDISSIDRASKRIVDAKLVTSSQAPTRARQWVQENDVLVSMTRPNLNAVAKISTERNGAVASTGFDVLRSAGVHPDWIFYRVRTNAFIADVCAGLQGVVYPAIRPRDVRRHKIPVPPIQEQYRIVDFVESYFTRLDDAVATLERVQRNLKRYRASVLKAAVEGRLVPTEAELACAENRDYEPAWVLLERSFAKRRRLAFTFSADLPPLPEGWSWVTIDQISEGPSSISAGPFGTIFKAKDFRPDGVPIIFLRHVKADAYHTARPTFMDQRVWEALFQNYSVYGGELLVTKLGEPPGECCVYPEGRGAAMLTPDVMKLQADETVVVPRFVMHYLNSTVAKQFAFGAAFGTTRLRLTLPLFRAMPVPLPPRREQVRIVAEVDRMLSIESETSVIAARRVTTVNRLRQSVLKWAFEGRLVDQDPTDEPASVLLERIRAERAALPARTRARARNSADEPR